MEKNQEHNQAVELLKELLLFKPAQDFAKDFNELFFAYLKTEEADNLTERQQMLQSHGVMIEFFTKISTLPQINPYGK